jgi:hypothetical protein
VEHFFDYVTALPLWFWGLGLGTVVPLGWGLGIPAGLTTVAVASWLSAPGLRTADEAFGTAAYRGSAAVIRALARVHTLSGLLPVCAWCKSVRTDDGYWQAIDRYLTEQTGAKLTHGMCPDGYGRHFGEGPEPSPGRSGR